MGLDALQHTLAKIYTDKDYRDKYFNNPESVTAALRLEAGSVQQLLRLKKEQVEVFAQGLINKRFGVVKNLLPLSCQYLSHQVKVHFQHYAEHTMIPSGPHKHTIDAIHFCNFLLNIYSGERLLQSIIKYERLINASSDIHKKILWSVFPIPVHQLYLKDFNPLIKRTTVIMFIRISARSRLKKFIFCI